VPDPDRVDASLTSNVWSGVCLPRLAPSNVYANVYGYFTQPDIQVHGWEHINQTDFMYLWVGLDGCYSSGSQDVAQAGTAAKLVLGATGTGWYSIASYHAFVEWFPDGINAIPDVPISPGNYYYFDVWMSDSTGYGQQPAGYMWYIVRQEEDGPSITGCIGPSGGGCGISTGSMHQPFIGDSAEWILENPQNGLDMVNFNTAQMQYANVFRSDEHYHVLHCDGNQTYDQVALFNSSTGDPESYATSLGSGINYGVVNYSWQGYR
jgi:hypothetical protein